MASVINENAPFPLEPLPFPFDLNEAVGDFEDTQVLLDLNQPPHDKQEYQKADTQTPMTQEEATQGETEPLEATGHHEPSRRLSSDQRLHVLVWLLSREKDGCLEHGAIQQAAQRFNISRRSISKLWNLAKQQRMQGQRYDVSTKFHNRGRKRIQVQAESISSINMGERSCIRDLASKLGISKSTVHRMVKRGHIKPHTNALHPGLKDANKITRLEWVLMLLQGDTTASKREYYTMFDFVHLDEKWFNLSKKSQRVYLAATEKGKYRAASSSKFILKVMFTTVVARPRFNSEGHCTFDGKIGIFPFTYQEAAKRSSKNREKGTLITKVVESVNKNATRDMLINQIIPAIKAKWPQDANQKIIFIQQDNAKPHITQDDPQWQQVYIQDGFTFILIQQPPNSPDLNILDLGFFRSIQSLMHKKMPKDVDAMIEAVNEAFYELDPKTLSNVWMTLQFVMNEILKARGGNDYELPHVNKKKLEAQGNLHTQVKAPMGAVLEAWDIVHNGAQLNQPQPVQDSHQAQPDQGNHQAQPDQGNHQAHPNQVIQQATTT